MLSLRYRCCSLEESFKLPVSSSYQEGAEEDEWDKVEVGKVGATAPLRFRRRYYWVGLTLLSPQTRQHDLLPWLPCGTPGHTYIHITQHQDEEGLVRTRAVQLTVYSQLCLPSGRCNPSTKTALKCSNCETLFIQLQHILYSLILAFKC